MFGNLKLEFENFVEFVKFKAVANCRVNIDSIIHVEFENLSIIYLFRSYFKKDVLFFPAY